MAGSTLKNDPIAIVGSACRFPGESTSPSKLWALLHQPRDVLKDFDPEHLNLSRFYNSNGEVHGATNVKNKTYLLSEDSRVFDPAFFGISPLEAEGMDPQQRILLETVFETFEAAGYTLDQMEGSKTSVHVGVMTGDYADIQLRDIDTAQQYCATGTGRSILSNRVSYIFDLQGPSVTIDTACSSSLVAVHQAIQSIQAGDSTAAIVGGVNLIFDPAMYIMEAKLHMLSPDSQSRMWDKDANGYARGEGVAALFLKPLSHALRDNDHIEGIIRGTGVNSDGHSQGITMPRAAAQAALIRETYNRAGLDPIKDRCQYFECHGTGTTAGDPVEARAIFESLLADAESSDDRSGSEAETDPLYVGSIKTVVGHLEGCAGLAGVMKVLLAINHRTIPPNMLFNELNPAIEPFYGKLQIPTSPLPWPKLQAGAPLRASVNSFGFGGTNAHAIIESYGPLDLEVAQEVKSNHEKGLIGPLVFSGHSGSSLLGNVKAFLQHLVEKPSIDIHDLTWVLQSRRSAHRAKTYFTADARQGLIESMEKFVADNENVSKTEEIGTRYQFINPTEVPGILGVFTGQGAQWPAMGRGLLETSPLFRKSIEQCDAVLKELPDGPEWSLIEELKADDSVSRMSEASISQPLCTAIQVALVDLLYASGVRFAAVVGHSSGEIAAVYACGIITLAGAMQIAYYRGKHAHLASGAQGESGAMLAVGITLEKAEEFCLQPEYQGRIGVAASNGPQSVTLSGDADVINRAKEYFELENTFARLLKVDTAYHSHHMERCADTYLKSITACNIEIRQPSNGCIWNSSVRGDTELLQGDLQSLKGSYWVKNMVNTVLFFQALKSSIWHGGPFDLAVEVGPHPALKGPTEQTLSSAFGIAPFYTGVLKRGGSDVQAFSGALGFCWTHLGPSFVDFEGYRKAFFEDSPPTPKVLKDLPSYSWDHDKVYWRESRISSKYRKGADRSHELLGRRVPDDNDREMRWRNILKLSELPWVRGHHILGEALLPGASYVALAFEAGKHLAAGKPIRLLEVQDVDIRRPLVVPPTREGTETIFTTHLVESSDPKILEAIFSYYYCPDERVGSMVHTCNGRLLVHLGTASGDELPKRGPLTRELLPVDVDDVYSVLDDVGMKYSGMFRRLHDPERTLDYASATATWTADEITDNYTAHPALIDVCFQTLTVARADPSTGHLPTTLLPVHIKRATLDPNVLWADESGDIKLSFESFVTQRRGPSLGGDLHIYNGSTGQAILQVETLSMKPVAEATEAQDRKIFSEMVFKPDASLGLVEQERNPEYDVRETQLAEDIDRFTLYYMQRVLEDVPPAQRTDLAWYYQRMFEAFERMVQVVRDGQHPLARKEWLNDGPEVPAVLFDKHPDQIDMLAIRVVGENILSVIRGEAQLLEVLLKDNVLGRVYMGGCGFLVITEAIVSVLRQISHKFPRANMLEIGAGTGATSWTVFETVGKDFGTYTYTDISTGFFETAADRFADFSDKMIFKALDIERDVKSQDFQEHAYDVVIAANVLHATSNITTSLKNARSLLKPGGFLLLVETTGIEILRTPFFMGGMPGWYLGAPDGRKLHPGVTTEEWDSRMQEAGFSGVDMAYHDCPDYDKHSFSFMVSQAVDDTLMQLRDPLGVPNDLPHGESLLIIGGKTLAVSKIAGAIKRMVPSSWRPHITMATDIEAVNFSRLPFGTDVVCLQELDSPIFSAPITDKRLKALQNVFLRAKNILWLTKNRRSGSPRSNMLLGISRALFQELPQANVQMLDLDSNEAPPATARTVLEAFLRLKIFSVHKHEQDKLLWTQEHEVVMEDGHMLVPRVIPNQEMNDRYNALNRSVTKSVHGTDIAVRVTTQQDKLVLTEGQPMRRSTEKENVYVKVNYSLLIPGEKFNGFYLSVGYAASLDTHVLAFSESNASILEVYQENLTPIDEKDCNPTTLQAITTQLLAQVVCNSVSNRESVLFYEPAETMVSIISAEFDRQGKEVLFASTRTSAPLEWIKIHPRSSVRAIQRLIPQTLAVYVDCSSSSSSHVISPRLGLPASCKTRLTDNEFLQQGLVSLSIKKSLASSYAAIQNQLSSADKKFELAPSYDMINIQDLSGADVSILGRTHVTSWETASPLTLTIQPPDRAVLFDPKKTYLMVGMAGGLGLSICEWALRQGAKRLVITSRNPNIQPGWLQRARLQGAEIHIHPMDVANKASVESVIGLIQKTLPPIAGVCNAAMVLKDRLFVDMDADSVNAALNPKVDGSQHLSDVLADTPLDFFILLSSGASVIGNPGQSNYHAANEFMLGLAKQRQQRGVAASVIHIGVVTDTGYVTRQARSVKAAFKSLQITFVSESDVHHAFAEAILAGKPDSGRSCEIVMGIDPIKKQLDLEERPAWLTDPRFSHLVPPTIVQKEQRLARSNQGNIKQLIEEVDTEEQAIKIVQDACCVKLESIMQLPAGSVEVQLSLIDLGIDSLVAVEIRTWFLKELGTDVPVLKILGGDSVAQICINAAKQVLAKKLDRAQKVQLEPEHTTDSTDSSSGLRDSSKTSSTAGDSENTTLSNEDSSAIVEANIKLEADEKDQEGANLELPSDPDVESVTDGLSRDVIREERMSGAQSRIWILSKYLKDPTTYNLMFSFEMEGNLDVWRLRNALTVTMQHHESLRSCFYARPEDNHPMQGILPSPVYRFKHIEEASDDDIATELALSKTKKWDIENGETLGVTVLSRSSQAHNIIFAYHHIIMDAMGWRVFLQDLNAAYKMRPLKHQSGNYLDYTLKQLRGEESGLVKNQLKYWQREFASIPQILPLLPMARNRARPRVQNVKTYFGYREIEPSLALAIKKTCQTLRITTFHFHLAIIQVLLSRSLGIGDLCIGVADANRLDDDFAETIGFFMNLLPVRFQVSKDIRFSQVAQSTSRKVFSALENSAVPFDMILDTLKIPRSSSYTPLFQVAVNYRLGAVGKVPLGDNWMTMNDVQDAKNPYDISFGIVEVLSGASMVEMTFQESLYDFNASQTILDTYIRLLSTFAMNPNCPLQDCQINNQTDVSKALNLGRGPQVKFDWPPTLSERVQRMCRAHAEKPAIKDRAHTLTYAKLESRINAIATALLDADCTSGSRIAVLCEPSADFTASLLAILHIGGIYVPLDVSLPSSRHEIIVESCQPKLLLYHMTTEESANSLACKYSLPKVSVDKTNDHHQPVICSAQADSPAVLLYTSGSTGKPKGVLLSQANFVNHLALKTKALGLAEGSESVLQQSSLGFDMSLIQTFCAIANGGTLVIVQQEARRDPVEITSLMLQHHVTLTIATPSEYLTWLRYGVGSLEKALEWKNACMGGEPVHSQLKHEFQRLGLSYLRLTNCYGPTEITAAATFHTISLESEDEPEAQSTSGKALPNYSICIVDPEGYPLPLGFRGEICIGGAGVALGYLDRPTETAQKFIPSIDGSGRMYRTGDHGRLTADGTLIFLGRLEGDTQIKLRGIRIELEEVEGALLEAADGLLSCVVVTVHHDVLIAHAILNPGIEMEEADAQQLLGRLRLPQYMCPAQLVIVDELPTGSNGKIDRKAVGELALPERASGSESRAKLTLREGELRLLWEKVLPAGSHALTPNSDFFLEGGNSLQLVKLQHSIKEAMGVAISTRELYYNCTLQQMAARVDTQREDQVPDDEKIDWALETAVPESIISAARQISESKRTSKQDGIEVLFTGATSFLGSAIVRALLQDSAVGKIHCIAILPDDQTKLPDSDKLISYTGSLSSPTLGLNQTECIELQSCIDVIVHAGASGHCLNNYSSVRAPNVHSTRFLASLAMPHSIPLIYISSNRVPLLSGNTTLPPVSVASFPPPTTGAEGFTASKWASEQFLENLSEHADLPIEVHRPCVVVGDSAPNSDALNAILRYALVMKSVPRFDRLEGYFDFKKVEEVAGEVALASVALANPANWQSGKAAGIRFQHHSSGVKVSVEEMREYLEQLHGCTFEEHGIRDWMDKALEAGIDPLITTYLEGLIEGGQPLRFPYLGEVQS